MPQTAQTPSLGDKAYRNALGTFATGVTIITAIDGDGAPVGLTANSFTSVSLDPPLILVCLDHRSKTLQALGHGGRFCVNVLGEDQRALALRFASKEPDKFAGVRWQASDAGAPVLEGSLCWLDCAVDRRLTAGDHEIVIGRVERFGEQVALPLGYFRGGFFSVSLEQEANARSGQTLFGAIIEQEGRVLLRLDRAAGRWDIPTARAQSNGLPIGGLLQTLAEAGVPSQLHFLFSVAELPGGHQTMILYRGEPTGAPALVDGTAWAFWHPDNLPWPSLASYETEMTLRRYFHERSLGQFNLFADVGTDGRLGVIDHRVSPYSPQDAERTLRPIS